METSATTHVHWQSLTDEEKAFVAAYVSNAYSVKNAAESIGRDAASCKRYLSDTTIRKAIYELQSELDNLDFLNENWVKTQLLHLYPKVIGEEKVPALDSEGMQIEVNKFYPEVAMKILEYIAPKKKDGEDDKPTAFNFNISLPEKK